MKAAIWLPVAGLLGAAVLAGGSSAQAPVPPLPSPEIAAPAPAPPAPEMSVDEMIRQLASLKAQRAEIDRQERELVQKVRRKMAEQQAKLRQLGLDEKVHVPADGPALPPPNADGVPVRPPPPGLPPQ